jgi:hypothetical protein
LVLIISIAWYVHNLSSFVDKISTLHSEHLPPSWAGCGQLDVWSTSVTVDVHWIWWHRHRSDSVRHFIKFEGLLLSSWIMISSESKIIWNIFSNSLHWKSWSEEHWSIDVESIFTVISLGSNLGSFVNIDNSPSLVGSVVSLPDNNLLSFGILVLEDINYLLVMDVNEVFTSSPEDLPPLWACRSNPNLLWTSTTKDCPWVASPVSRFNGQSLLVEPEDLSLSTISSLDMEVSVREKVEVSLLA